MSTLQNVDFFQNVNFTERALLILMFLLLPVGKAVSVQWTILSRNNLCFVALHTRGVTWPYFRGQKWHFIQPQHSLYLDRFIAERERGRKSANYWRFFCIPNCTFSTNQGCFHLNYNYYEQTKIKQNSLFSLSFSYLITRVAAGCEFMPLNSDPDPTFHFQFQIKKKLGWTQDPDLQFFMDQDPTGRRSASRLLTLPKDTMIFIMSLTAEHMAGEQLSELRLIS